MCRRLILIFAKLLLGSEVNVIRELKGSPGNHGFGYAQRVQTFNLQTGHGSAGRCHCPAVERVGGFNKLTNGNGNLVFKLSQRL